MSETVIETEKHRKFIVTHDGHFNKNGVHLHVASTFGNQFIGAILTGVERRQLANALLVGLTKEQHQ